MKRSFVLNALLVALAASLFTTGCKHKSPAVDSIPNIRNTEVPQPGPGTGPVGNNGGGGDNQGNIIPRPTNPPVQPLGGDGAGGITLPDGGDIFTRPHDTNTFAANTVYFDFDRFNVKNSEKSKVEQVAEFFKNPQNGRDDLLIEGHCDERGTEQYNLALGERRALSLRETLVGMGVSAAKIHVISYGLSRPAAFGHDEASWSKNRRGVFVLVLPSGGR